MCVEFIPFKLPRSDEKHINRRQVVQSEIMAAMTLLEEIEGCYQRSMSQLPTYRDLGRLSKRITVLSPHQLAARADETHAQAVSRVVQNVVMTLHSDGDHSDLIARCTAFEQLQQPDLAADIEILLLALPDETTRVFKLVNQAVLITVRTAILAEHVKTSFTGSHNSLMFSFLLLGLAYLSLFV
jgi:hypothetical protein